VRLLTLKYQLYPEFTLDEVIPAEDGLSQIGKGNTVTFRVAQQGATLMNPDAAELSTSLPRPPDQRDRLIFLTDTLDGRQCSSCRFQPVMPVKALENAVLRLYGPRQVTRSSSISCPRILLKSLWICWMGRHLSMMTYV
jgi:beta-N-acetylhexosaminidase